MWYPENAQCGSNVFLLFVKIFVIFPRHSHGDGIHKRYSVRSVHCYRL